MTVHQTLLPPGWPRPKGYANGIAASGRLVVTGGLVGWDEHGYFADGGLAGQFHKVLENLIAVLNEAGAGPEHLVRLTWYIVSRDDYIAELPRIGAAYRELIGHHYPAMAVVEVKGLIESEALVEIEATAVVPDARP